MLAEHGPSCVLLFKVPGAGTETHMPQGLQAGQSKLAVMVELCQYWKVPKSASPNRPVQKMQKVPGTSLQTLYNENRRPHQLPQT